MKMDKALLKSCYSFIAVHNALKAHGITPDNDTVFAILEYATNAPSGGSHAIGFETSQTDEYEEDITAMSYVR